MKRCTKCVLPASFPGISFSADGVCSICEEFGTRVSEVESTQRQSDRLQQIIAESKAKDHQYDAVVAYSGGKDSSFLLYILQKTFGLRLLAVTFDNGYLSKANCENMHSVVTALNIDHTIVKYRQDHLNSIFMASALSRVYPDHLTKFGSNVCISCIRMVMTATLRTAIEKHAPMVMLGNSPGQLLRSDEELIYQDYKIPFALRRNLFAKIADRTGPWVYKHLMLTAEEYLTRPFPYFISPLPILGYDEAEIYSAIAKLGWSKPKDVDPNSTNCRLNAFGIIRHKNLHGFHPYDYEMSQLVRIGAMTRDVALAKLSDPGETAVVVAAEVEKKLLCGSCGNQGCNP